MIQQFIEVMSKSWKLISTGEDNRTNVALAIALISVVTGVGLAVVALYGAAAPARASVDARLASALLAMMAALTAFAVGGAFGFLFGVPRWTDVQVGKQDTERKIEASQDGAANQLRPNTSLERITDWLTTIIVGLGLVHLKEMQAQMTDLGLWLTGAIERTGVTNATPGVVIVTGNAIAGFLFFYLWTTRFLPREMSRVFERMRSAEQRAQTSQGALEKVLSDSRFVLSADEVEVNRQLLQQAGFAVADINEVLDRLSKARTWNDEPFRGFGPTSAQGFTLDVAVSPSKEYRDNFDLAAKIVSSAGPLQAGAVAFLMHHTFARPVVLVDAASAANPTIVGPVAESFVMGALIQEKGKPSVRLSLDMATIPGVPKAFVSLAS